MAIADPQKPWAVVLCSIEGSTAQPALVDVFRALFSASATHSTIVDFWKDSTLNLVDLSGSQVFGWYDSGYTMIGSRGLSSYIGVSEGGPSPIRGDLVAHARQVLQQNNPGLDLSQFRSILAVYNFDFSAGQSGEDVAYGLLPGPLSWAQLHWSHCTTCSGLFRSDAAGSVCAASVGGTPFAHTTDGNELQVPNVATLQGALAGFSTCRRCGVLYELTRTNGCPAGGAHADDGTRLYLPSNWESSWASGGWQRCQDCGLVLQPGSGFLCPVTKAAHVTLAEKFSFPAVAFAPPSLTWMCHEMGHAYGFIHGRSSQPDSTDLSDDASPGAYGDPYDIMSAMHCAHFNNDQGYVAGPALATHQLMPMTAVPIQKFEPSKGFDSILIRTPDASGTAPILAQMGDLVAELRMHTDPRGLPGWDRALDFGPTARAAVLVHNTEPFAPTLMMSTKGNPYLLEGDRFLSREGEGQIAIEVSDIDEQNRTARLTVWNQTTLATGALQRWLVIPCTYNGDPTAGATQGELDALLQDVEGYWSNVSGGGANIGGHYVLQPARPGILRYVVPMSPADALAQTPSQRVQRIMEVVQRDLSPLKSGTFPFLPLPRWLDWRWFTGIIVINDLPTSGGFIGTLRLPSGNLPKSATTTEGFNAVQQEPIGDGFGLLNFAVIEAGIDRATAASLNIAVGASLDLQATAGDPYHLMNGDAGTLRAATGDQWTPNGPFVSTDQMDSLGWLAGRDLVIQIPYEAKSTSDRATLVALTKRSQQSGWLRANFGAVRCECRYSEGLDAALPPGTVVLVWDSSGPPRALRQGESISWVGATLIDGTAAAAWLKIFGGGSLTVVAADYFGATIAYQASAGMRIIDIPVPWEVLMTLPPGDPWEKRFENFVNEHIRPEAERFLAEVEQEVRRQGASSRSNVGGGPAPGQRGPA